MEEAAGRRRCRDPLPALSAGETQPAWRTSRGGPSRAAGPTPSFVGYEGYDTVAVLAEALRRHGTDRARIAESWPGVTVEGTRGRIGFGRAPGGSVWQWAGAPVQVADRDPADPDRFRVLHVG